MVSTTSLRCRRVIDFNIPLCTHNVERILQNIVEIKPGLFSYKTDTIWPYRDQHLMLIIPMSLVVKYFLYM